MDYNDDFMNPKEEQGSFVKGVLLGAFMVLLCALTTIAILIKVDVLTINKNSTTVIEDNTKSLASKVYAKLSLLESKLSDFYFETVDDETVIDDICKAYLKSFGDKYTVYYNKNEFAKLLESNSGSFVGIGVTIIQTEDGAFNVVEVMDDSPAQKGGVKAGDIIVAVEGQEVTGKELSEVSAIVRGEAGTKVNIGIKREGQEDIINLELTREAIDYETVGSLLLEDDIYYIQISQFVGTTPAHFKREYDKCIQAGAKGIVIDIRENPGGMKESVLEILDMLCPKGILMYTEDKFGKRINEYAKTDEEANIPIAVLVNGNSASASEVFSGTMQDYGKATIVGTQTFGKGIVQTIKSVGDGSGLKYTTSKYYTAKGQDIHGKGVTPDVVIEYEEKDIPDEEFTYRDDNQVMKCIEILKEKINK